MEQGNERNHLLWILEFVDFKGSEVRIREGTIVDGSTQAVPYPASVWDWQTTQSYSWALPQHINVLELLAFLNYLKAYVLNRSLHGMKFLHVFDSRVCSCVISKGRSSSRMLNRILRRIAALSLASDVYPLPLWTISAWNFADHGSRAVTRPPKKPCR